MASKRNKSKISMKKIKKICKLFFDKLKDKIMGIVQKIKESSKEFKILFIMWLIIIIVIVSMLVICSSNNKNIKKHKLIESEISAAALDYVEEKEIYSTVNQKFRVTTNVLLESGNLYKDSITDKTCDGYALVYYSEDSEEYKATSYIKCDSYVTKDYSSK